MRPWSLVVAAGIVAAEGLVALGLGAYALIGTLAGEATETTAALAEAAFGLLVGAGLIWVAVGGLLRAERWGRAPGVLTQIFLIPVSVTVMQSGWPAIGVPLLAAAIAGLGTLLAPPTTKALYGD